MGGSAFTTADHGLFTPRMPPHLYHGVMAGCRAKLGHLYAVTASPLEAPGKKDYGDIDILVAAERAPVADAEGDVLPASSGLKDTHRQLLRIGETLEAKYSIIHSPPVSANFAIPWPRELGHAAVPRADADNTEDVESTEGQRQQDMRERFIQVDVRICSSTKQVEWALFKHGHGDLWNILGSIIRPYGLTVDEQALWIRIPEIEKFDKKQAKVRLSDDPAAVMDFLGMKYQEFWTEPFESVDALYEYVMTCRLLPVRGPSAKLAISPSDDSPGVAGGTEARSKLKSNDRRRMKQRPIYRDWIDVVVPRLEAEGRIVCKDPDVGISEMRTTVREEAFRRFSPSAQKDYHDRLSAWLQRKQLEAIKGLIKEMAPGNPDKANEPHYRSIGISALKKIILEDDQSFGVYLASSLKKDDGLYDMDHVRAFIAGEGAGIADIAWEKHRAKSREAMSTKLERLKAQEERQMELGDSAGQGMVM